MHIWGWLGIRLHRTVAIAAAVQHHLERIATYLKSRRGDDVSLADVLALAEITAQSLQDLFASLDGRMHRELRGIADYIATMKAEIEALQFGEIKRTRIPAAARIRCTVPSE